MNPRTRPLHASTILLSSVLILGSQISHAMINGTRAGAKYAAVGTIIDVGDRSGKCTATLIAPDWIVTADHCREGGSDVEPVNRLPEQMLFQIGKDDKRRPHAVKLSRWISFPAIQVMRDAQPEEFAIDVAFAQLSQPITQINGRKIDPIPLSLNAGLMNHDSRKFEVVGFGVGSGGKRMKAPYKVTTVRGNAFKNIFSDPGQFLKYVSTAHPGEEVNLDRLYHDADVFEGYTVHAWDERGRENGVLDLKKRPAAGWSSNCSGDSGGPLLEHAGSRMRVVGIIMGGFRGELDGCIPLGGRMGVFGPEIQKVIRAEQIPAVE